MSQIILRAACEADADAMLKIYTPYVTSTRASWEYEPPRPDIFAARVRAHLDAGFPWLLAEEGGVSHAGNMGHTGSTSHAIGVGHTGNMGHTGGTNHADGTSHATGASHTGNMGHTGGTSHADGTSYATGASHAGSTVLGYAYAGRLGERRGYDWDAEATVYLSAAAHRRHIGTALYTALLELLRAQGYVNCYALITDPTPAIEAFHRRMGFAEAARLPGAGYKQGQWIGLYYFHKLLCAPPERPVPPVPLCALDDARVAEILEDAARLCGGAENAAKDRTAQGNAAESGTAEGNAVSGCSCSSGAVSAPCTETEDIL